MLGLSLGIPGLLRGPVLPNEPAPANVVTYGGQPLYYRGQWVVLS